MAFGDMFKAGDYKKQVMLLEQRVHELESLLTPEMRDVEAAKRKLATVNQDIALKKTELSGFEQTLEKRASELRRLYEQVELKKKQSLDWDDALLVEEFGLYKPRFDFANSSQFKDRLAKCREQQKACVKRFNAEAANTSWTVNNSKAQGKKMIRETSRLIMRAYNGECDEIVRKVTYSNIGKSIERVHKSAEAVNRLGATLGISIPREYEKLKEDEVRLAFEFAQQKEEEREKLREAREAEREARKLAQEIAAERKKLEKERKQYLSAYKEIAKRLESATDEERADLEEKAEHLKRQLDDVAVAVANVDYREANQRAGFVYIISNIGAFGENVYKIGMTRRLEPMDRVRELGDASVPFRFDVHALIFSDDAPKLEAALHRAFEDRKVNMKNPRREFFKVTLPEIEEVVKKNFDKTVEFTEFAEAVEFRESELLRKGAAKH